MNKRLLRSLGLLLGLLVSLQPSYVHPDEHFQSIEILQQQLRGIRGTVAWEFKGGNESRSIVPLYLWYAPAILLSSHLKTVRPLVAMYIMRMQNYLLFLAVWKVSSRVLESSKLRRSSADLLMCTSYVVGGYLSHTFSNSIEAVILLAVLSMMEILVQKPRQEHEEYLISGLMGVAVALGVFNRITFGGFILLPGLLTFGKFYWRHWRSLLVAAGSCLFTAAWIIWADSKIYQSNRWVIAPLNNLLYNINEDNLAQHGLHSRSTHLLVNLPQLLGPALIPALRPRWRMVRIPFLSCISGLLVLSMFKHQEVRFLVPLVPALFLSIETLGFARLISSKTLLNVWLIFNIAMAAIVGIGHQRGVITALNYLKETPVEVQVWWKTYSPPTWILMNQDLTVSTTNFVDGEERVDDIEFRVTENHIVDLKGSDIQLLNHTLTMFLKNGAHVNLIMPDSVLKLATKLRKEYSYELQPLYSSHLHIDLDHIDVKDLSSLRPGITVYNINKIKD
ncbi:HFL163Wp [Eremothecium sinecaudum]|uniref:Mannosyltransferase n=1 Tax=Eremothecium sinecaudum TaxID=45286 RepID=A0A109V0C5_9SACH|nr:HFL163Wp [Eremothecium sinecaudum]AMD21693.1 HFL163Wp [Eremothecium sinecaudum]